MATPKSLAILEIQDVLKKNLHLPDYQRPYKWQTRHVQQLLSDLLHHFNNGKKIYRIGTVVLHGHGNDGQSDIVDGQQRLTTLTLLLHCLGEPNLRLLNAEYRHSISQENIRQNYAFIQNFVTENLSSHQKEFKEYILKNCEMVCVELDSLDEAFQFFDSQNARGKPLEAYDLLKAYHLRAMQEKGADTIYQCVAEWEQAALAEESDPNLHKIINQVLFRLRVWQIDESGEQFSSDKLPVFKGISEHSNYPFMQAFLTSLSLAKCIQPSFQAKQTIIDGEYFFAYVQYYRKMYRQLFDEKSGLLCKIQHINGIKLDKNLITFLNNHKHANRTGDYFLRGLFECLVLAYFDKFGEERLDNFINKAFVWVYRLRVEWQRIAFTTIDNTAMEKNSLFTHLDRSHTPDMVMMFNNLPIEKVEFSNVDEKIKEILGVSGANQ